MDKIWKLEEGEGPLVAAAVHNGHRVREELAGYFALSEEERLREEDPFTGAWTCVGDTRIVGLHSRFEVDLNRPREKAVYLHPEDAWGLEVWKEPLPPRVVDRSLAAYEAFYREIKQVLEGVRDRHGRFVVYDLHSYNHRRQGPEGPEAEAELNPEVNVGTGSMDRERWAPVVERFMDELRQFDFQGRHLDVRENVKFRGGHFPQWVHETFPKSGCALAIEFKKFFMDEWTGEPDREQLEAIRRALEATVPGVLDSILDVTG